MNALLTVIFFLLMPILIIGVFVLIKYRRKRVIRRVLERALNQLTGEDNLLIADIEFFRNKVIGIDRRNKKLVYANFRKEAIDQFFIDLNSLAFCRVNQTIDKSSNRVKEVFIEVKCKNTNKMFILKFYDRSIDDIRAKALLLEKAEHWKNKINLHRRSVNFNNQFEYVL